MAFDAKCEPLATSLNGVVTPLYFDRQIVRAEDLTLDRSSHDAELARMRRLLHGWGIVVGFALVNGDEEKQSVTVTPGYGITPNGNEIYLTQAVELPHLLESLQSCCGTGMPGCDIIDEKARELAEEMASYGWVQGWLVARPYHSDRDLRPGVPEGCGHPANALLPTRRCEGMTFDIVCCLPYPHIQDSWPCDAISEWMCRTPEEGRDPLPLPVPVDDCDDYLVIGRISFYERTFQYSYENRRPLLPVSLLQDWVTSCMCGFKSPRRDTAGMAAAAPAAPAAGPPSELLSTSPPASDAIAPGPDKSFADKPSWAMFQARATANGLEPADLDGVSQGKLLAAGIDAPGKLLSADLDAVSFSTGIAKSKLEVIRNDILKKRFLLNAPQI
ncbi:MAG: hypothetical protein ACOH2J_10550 [Allorhizobium sp.]